MNRKAPYTVDYGKPKKKSFGFFKFFFLIIFIATIFTLVQNNFLGIIIDSADSAVIENKLSNQTDQLIQLKKDIDVSQSLRNQIEELNIKIKGLNINLDTANKVIDGLEALNAKKIKEINSLNGQIDSVNLLNDDLVEENDRLKFLENRQKGDTEIATINSLASIDLKLSPVIKENAVKDLTRMPKLIKSSNPQYPRNALLKNLEGRVTVIFDVDSLGQVTNIRIQQSSNYIFNKEARKVVKNSKYMPASDAMGYPVYYSDLKKVYEFKMDWLFLKLVHLRIGQSIILPDTEIPNN